MSNKGSLIKNRLVGYFVRVSSPALDICHSFSVNLERFDGFLGRLVAPHIPQIISLKNPVLSFIDFQLHDVEGQISRGQELLDSGGSVNQEQLRAQLAILSTQREGLLAQKGGLEVSS